MNPKQIRCINRKVVPLAKVMIMIVCKMEVFPSLNEHFFTVLLLFQETEMAIPESNSKDTLAFCAIEVL